MDALAEDLAALVNRESLLTEPDYLMTYECDSLSFFKQRPRAVVLPRTTEEVSRILAYLSRKGIPFTARGSGTGLSGGATPVEGGVVISLARMDRILEVHPRDRCALVQAGVVNTALSKALEPLGLHFAPDPASQPVCSLGGNVGENAGGPHCFKHGMTLNHTLGLTLVLPGGEVLHLGGPCGEPDLDLAGLVVASEGTLGIVTEIWVRLTPNPETFRTLLASFRSLEDCSRAVSRIVRAGIVPSAMEILDKKSIEIVEASVNKAGYPLEAGAVLLVELDGRPEEMERPLSAVEEACRKEGALEVEFAKDPEHRMKLWKGRKGVYGTAGRLAPDVYVMDGVVPRNRLAEALHRIQEVTDSRGLVCPNIAHAGDGNVHPTICYDGRDPEQAQKAEEAGREILRICLELGGTITGEHGVGLEKLSLMPEMFPPGSLRVMRRVKAVFDPAGLANPGKLIPLEEP